jgi:hypothetical protein
MGYIPSSVTHLTFNDNYDRSVENAIPVTVTHLVIGKWFGTKNFDNIPISVKEIRKK